MKKSEPTFVNSGSMSQFELFLKGKGIGFYQISIQNYQYPNIVHVWILDPLGKTISLNEIRVKTEVNYFEFERDGNYLIQVRNPSNKTVEFVMEYGDTHSSQLLIPGIVTGMGAIFLIYAAFRKMTSYWMIQP